MATACCALAGLGIFFDTFQNLDHSHHHKHPYIYAVMNDGTKGWAPPRTVPALLARGKACAQTAAR